MTAISSLSATSYVSSLLRFQTQGADAQRPGALPSDRSDKRPGAAAAADSQTASGRSAGFGDRVGSLIDGQVASGTLTGDQAKELKGIFEGAGASRGTSREGRVAESDGTDSSAATGSAAGSASSRDLVASFVQTLKDNLTSSYSDTGRTTRAASSLIVDIKA